MKIFIKRALYVIASLCVLPLYAGLLLARGLSSGERFFQGASQLLSLVPFHVGVYFRAAFYALACTAVDREIAVGFLTLLSHADTDIGRNVYIGPQSNIGSCSLGQDCLLGSGVHVLSGKRQHNFSDALRPIREQGGIIEKIQIGRGCWIGNNAIIMADVGACSIIAAAAVVVDKVPPHSIAAGNPARVVGSR